MTNPFTAFAFPTTGTSTNRTLPDRLQDVHNVKDFGALGDGMTDDWAAITAAFNWNNVKHTVNTSPNNKVASFTGVISAVPTFQGSISGSTLTAAPTIDGTFGTLTLGTLAISSYTYNSTTGEVDLTMSGSVAFNATTPIMTQGLNINGLNLPSISTFASGTSVKYIGPTGLAGVATGGGSLIVGGILAVGQTVSGAFGSDTIASLGTGSGGAGTYNLNSSHGTVTTQSMATNCILVATSVTGTIAVADNVLNNAGTVASPNVVYQNNDGATRIASSPGGGAGTYVLTLSQNFLSQAMFTASSTITMNTAFPNNIPSTGFIRNNSNASCGHPTIPSLPVINHFDGTNILTIDYINGLYSANDVLEFMPAAKGTIYFPPGNYVVSQPILVYYSPPDNVTAIFQGDWGGTTITGAFPDYVFKRTFGFSNFVGFEKLNIVNTDPNGGGIRSGGSTSSFIRDVTVTANRGISNFDRDSAFFIQQGNTSLDHSWENLFVTAGTNVTNSIGFMMNTNGPVINCRASGCAIGMVTAGGEGATNLFGCYFENCGIALAQALAPSGELSLGGGVNFMGGWIKNCGQGIAWDGSTGFYGGIRIEGTNGQAPSSTNPQYGIIDAQASGGSGSKFNGILFGVIVTGQYDQFAISLNGQNTDPQTTYAGVSALNTGSGAPWQLQNVGASVAFPTMIACNKRPIYTVATGTVGAPVEGDTFDVNDCNTASWGATAGGNSSGHALLRNNGTNITVMGI